MGFARWLCGWVGLRVDQKCLEPPPPPPAMAKHGPGCCLALFQASSPTICWLCLPVAFDGRLVQNTTRDESPDQTGSRTGCVPLHFLLWVLALRLKTRPVVCPFFCAPQTGGCGGAGDTKASGCVCVCVFYGLWITHSFAGGASCGCLEGGSERTVPVHGVPWGLSAPVGRSTH